MAEVRFITRQQADEAKKKPVVTRGDPATQSATIAPYFLEEVRKELEGRYGAKQLYENGLTIQTALDLRLQDVSNRALETGLRAIDHCTGSASRGATSSTSATRSRHSSIRGGIIRSPSTTSCRRWSWTSMRPRHPSARRRPEVTIDKKGYAWTRKTIPAQLVTRGDLVEAKLLTIDPAEHTATACSISRPRSKVPSWPSTIAPVRSR